jgi:PqqD family protein of HPr-rel-A system
MTPTIKDLPAGTHLIADPNLVLREEEDDAALLFDPETGSVRVLNSTALAVFKLLDGKRDLHQIMADLNQDFSDMDQSAEQQVVELLDYLQSIGAVGVLSPDNP